MKAFYEKYQEESQSIKIFRNVLHVFEPHFHNNVEIFIVRKGHYTVSLGDTVYDLKSGGVCVFDSYDIHGYISRLEDDADDVVVIIPAKYLGDFRSGTKGKRITNPVLYDELLCDRLLAIADEYLSASQSEEIHASAINLFLSLIKEKLCFSDATVKSDDITVHKILSYIYDNFTSDISLSTIAKALGYTAEHLSRVFHKYVNMSIPLYINNLRIERVEKLKKERGDKKIYEIIAEAGFNSIQTYYRAKKQYEKNKNPLK